MNDEALGDLMSESEIVYKVVSEQAATINKALKMLDEHYKDLLGSITSIIVSVVSPLVTAAYKQEEEKSKTE